MLQGGKPSFAMFPRFFRLAIDTNDNALYHPEVKKLLNDRDTKFDVVVVCALVNDVGYYLAHRFKASLALYLTTQNSFTTMDHAMGMPNNPALQPLGFFPFPNRMVFWQRAVNTIGAFAFEHLFR